MRTIIIGCCILLCFPLFGQRKKKVKKEQYLHIQGAFFYDGEFNPDYAGFNLINTGWTQYKDKSAQSFELELIGFESDGDEISTPFGLIPESTRTNRSLELIYARTYAIFGTTANGFYVGPTVSFNLNSNTFLYYSTSRFPTNLTDYSIGFGVKTGYNWQINKRFLFNISTRLRFFNTGLGFVRFENPNIPINLQRSIELNFDLVKSYFPILFGFSYKI